jgi:uncharacterized protein YndB with AHSA1/START domain
MDEVTVQVAAPPEHVWSLVTDVTQTGRWSPECTGCAWEDGADRAVVGARFKGHNRHGAMRWTTHCEVVAAEEPTHFAFQVKESGMRWGYRFEPDGEGGTNLTEYRDKTRPVPLPIRLVQRSGILGRDREGLMVKGMRETLERVKAAAEQA